MSSGGVLIRESESWASEVAPGGDTSRSAGELVLCASGVSSIVRIEKSGWRWPACCEALLLALALPVFPMASPRHFSCACMEVYLWRNVGVSYVWQRVHRHVGAKAMCGRSVLGSI
eukprot:6184553-Pleurochrysis_carterae.AAC.1